MFCCRGFEILVENAGKKGISVLVFKTDGRIIFELQSRAFSKEDEILFVQGSTPLGIKGNMMLLANIRLSYCPYCGTRLQSLIKKSTKEALETLAAKHTAIYRRPFS